MTGKRRNNRRNTHVCTHTHTETLTTSLGMNSVAGLNRGEKGVKGGRVTADVQIILYNSTSLRDLHASLTIVKNRLNWL